RNDGPPRTTYLRYLRRRVATERNGWSDASDGAAGEPGGGDQGNARSVGQMDVRRGVQEGQVGPLPGGQDTDVVAPQGGRTACGDGVQGLGGGHAHLAHGQG